MRNRSINYRTMVAVLVFGLMVCFPALANPLQKLIENDQLIIKASLSETSRIARHQQILVNIDILTDTWFTQGTRIHRFEVQDALVLQREKFATNSTERINGKVYSKQRWEVAVYPLGKGKFYVPEIAVEVGVRGNDGNISGMVATQPLTFDVTLPRFSLYQHRDFMVGTDANIEDDWKVVRADGNGSPDVADLRVGDAIERTITLRVKDSSAALLPTLISETESTVYQTFIQSPSLVDEQNRGEYLATRTEKVVYVMREAGDIRIPKRELQFWDTQTGELQLIVLPEKHYRVEHTLYSYVKSNGLQCFMGALLVVFCCGLFVIAKREYAKKKAREQLPLWWLFAVAVKDGEETTCESLLYKKRQQRLVNGFPVSEQFNSKSFEDWLFQKYSRPTEIAFRLSRFQWVKIWCVV